MKKSILILLFIVSLNTSAQNQNWNATSINGINYNIDSIVNSGTTVLVDISAYWCMPCWDWHLKGYMEKMYKEFGPAGTNDLLILLIDGDPTSSIASLQGGGGQSMGDWIGTTPYPIIGPYGEGAAVKSNYVMNGYPTLFIH